MAEDQQQATSEQDFLVDVGGRVRTLEGKYNLLRDRVLVVNQNMVTEYKKTLIELKALNNDVKEVKTDIFRLKEALKHLVKELEYFARKEDVKVLEKYINLWNPMHFMTEQEVVQLLSRHQLKQEESYGSKPRIQ